MSYYCPLMPSFNVLTYAHPRLFKTSSLNDPKISLNTERSKYPYTCSASTLNPKFQSILPAVFALQAFLRPVRQIIQK